MIDKRNKNWFFGGGVHDLVLDGFGGVSDLMCRKSMGVICTKKMKPQKKSRLDRLLEGGNAANYFAFFLDLLKPRS